MKFLLLFFSQFLFFSFSVHASRLTAYIPDKNPTGTAVIVCPGGSYFWIDKDIEGKQVAQWLRDNGIAAFVLEYSHGGWASFAFHVRFKEPSFPAAYQDLRQALDSVRNHAGEYGVRPDRIGCMGFSAGGHLVMHTAEQVAATPSAMAFVASIYPVVSMTHPCTHKRSRRGLLGEFPSEAMKDSLSIEKHIHRNCPPVFLMNCDDDPVVDYRNAELLDSALTAKNIKHKYIQYKTGGHGFGASEDKGSEECRQWKNEFLKWLKENIY